MKKKQSQESQNKNHKVIVFGNQKGGIGKTFSTLAVASKKSLSGEKILIVDLDSGGHATSSLLPESDLDTNFQTILEISQGRVHIEEAIISSKISRVDLLPADQRIKNIDDFYVNKNPAFIAKNMIKDIASFYDLIFFDVGPSFSRVISSAYLAADIVFIPITPDTYSIEAATCTVQSLLDACFEWRVQIPTIKIFFNRFTTRNSSLFAEEFVKKSSLAKFYSGIKLPETTTALHAINQKDFFLKKVSSETGRELRNGIENLAKIVSLNNKILNRGALENEIH